jgi:hypothetical protein
MTDPSRPAQSSFASGGLPEHLARGALGIGAIVAAVWVTGAGAWWATPVSLALGVGSLIAFRGCPMCWTIGLVEAVWQVTHKR